MKIVAFIRDLSKGGAQGVFVDVVNHLYNCGYEMEVVVQTLDDPIFLKKINSNIKITSLNSAHTRSILLKLKEYFDTTEFTHALVFGSEIAVMIYILRKIQNKKFKIIGRSLNTLSQEFLYTDKLFRKVISSVFIKFFFNKIDIAIAQSLNMAEDMVVNWGFSKSRVFVINNPLKSDYEVEAKCRDDIKKDSYILYAGRLEKQKGLEMLLSAFSKIKDTSVKLKIVGAGSLREFLIGECNSLNVRERVEFIDYTEDILGLYKSAKVVVLTSYYEGFPNVLIEAIACGTPIVAYDLPSGPKEIILEDINGYLVPYLQVEDFSKALDRAIEKQWNTEKIKETSYRYFSNGILNKYVKIIEEIQ